MVTQSLSRSAVQAPATADWLSLYRRTLWVSDAIVVIAVMFATQYAWFTLTGEPVSRPVDSIEPITYTWLSMALITGWLVALSISGSRSARTVGIGTLEYRKVISSTVYLFAALAIVSYLLSAPISRGYLLLAFPLGTALLLANRALWRRRLWSARRAGQAMSRVLVIGDDGESARIISELERTPEAGYHVVGIAGPGRRADFTSAGLDVPFLGPVRDVDRMLERTGADTVIVASDAALGVEQVRKISWQLEAGRQHLIMVPSLTDIGGPRMHTRPVAGLPLMHVETPRYSGRQRVVKRTFDILGSAALLLVLAPLFAVLALLVKASGPGDVFYRQERIGKEGVPFGMIKFRSMIPDADAQLAGLLAGQGTEGTPLFKVENDPRITPIGRILRKYSLDEFPQLINVLKGDMSLVGPRPQRRAEVEYYDSAAERRLIVKPGMSGLWQVSGRSALGWDEALRLDLYYVENWTLLGDISILFRTFKAVVAPGETAH
ncbi:sugar transferase [Microbacterium sp. LRZ72]|uniref:sugar transferase n=1 Tax=Microbacterium sp. LRZ72 TaxID=2942481 RepID=UPI0029B888A0|nr:sugar transferase [Microbacterium sp. LRZ72]MDX2376589.1 sugar transferase [Microbacterium sp. LRZ72]